MWLREHIKNSKPDSTAPKRNTRSCSYDVHKLKTLEKITEITGDGRQCNIYKVRLNTSALQVG